MKPITIMLVALLITLAGCGNNPVSPTTDPEVPGTVSTAQGILLQEDLDTTIGAWEIPVSFIGENCALDTWVRTRPGYVWRRPLYFSSMSHVRIYADSATVPGMEYLIVGACGF